MVLAQRRSWDGFARASQLSVREHDARRTVQEMRQRRSKYWTHCTLVGSFVGVLKVALQCCPSASCFTT